MSHNDSFECEVIPLRILSVPESLLVGVSHSVKVARIIEVRKGNGILHTPPSLKVQLDFLSPPCRFHTSLFSIPRKRITEVVIFPILPFNPSRSKVRNITDVMHQNQCKCKQDCGSESGCLGKECGKEAVYSVIFP